MDFLDATSKIELIQGRLCLIDFDHKLWFTRNKKVLGGAPDTIKNYLSIGLRTDCTIMYTLHDTAKLPPNIRTDLYQAIRKTFMHVYRKVAYPA